MDDIDDDFTPLAELETKITGNNNILSSSNNVDDVVKSVCSNSKYLIFTAILVMLLVNSWSLNKLASYGGFTKTEYTNAEDVKIETQKINIKGTLLIGLAFLILSIILKILCYFEIL